MTSILYVGLLPETADLSDQVFPSDATVETIYARIHEAQKNMVDNGWAVDLCLTPLAGGGI